MTVEPPELGSRDRETVDDLVTRLRELVGDLAGPRTLVGLAGAPGSGKSTLAAALVRELGPDACVVVPMDGFHLADEVLLRLGRRDRKGAIDTFDADGYRALLARLVERTDQVVYAPSYRRGLEEPVAGAIAVPRQVPLVLTEGNYLLAGPEPWPTIRGLLDEVWFVDTPDEVRRPRLVERHVRSGMDPDAALAWSNGPDETNARLVAETRERADRIVTWG